MPSTERRDVAYIDRGSARPTEIDARRPGPVLLVTPWYTSELGGVAKVAERLHLGLKEAGVEAHLLVTEGGREIAPHPDAEDVWTFGVPTYLFQSLSPRAIAGSIVRSGPTARRLHRFIRDHRIQAALILYPIEQIWPFVLMREMGRLRIVTSLHGNDVELFDTYPRQLRWLVRRGLSRSDTVVVCAEHLAGISQAICPDVELPTRVIPNCVDTSHFTPPPASHRRTDRRPTIVHISNFARKKRPRDIVEAFAKAELPEGARLVMVGEGPELEATRQRAHELELSEAVEFVGVQDDVRPFLWDSDVFTLASDSEGAPLVLLEAMACGVPWVSTAWGAAADLPPGECGLVVPPADPDRFALALSEIMGDDERRRAMAERARQRALTDYSVRAYVDAHIEVLLAAEGGTGRRNGRASSRKRL